MRTSDCLLDARIFTQKCFDPVDLFGKNGHLYNFYGLVFSLCPSVSHSIFHRAVLTYFVPCCYCELDDFAIVFPNSVCTYMHLFMIIHKHIQAVESLFSLIFCFVHVCMCVHVYFIVTQTVTCREEISFYLLCICFASCLLVLATKYKYAHIYVYKQIYIWILNVEMSCLYVSVTYLLLFSKFLFWCKHF